MGRVSRHALVKMSFDHCKKLLRRRIQTVSIRSPRRMSKRSTGPPRGPRGNIHELLAVLANDRRRQILVQIAAEPCDLRQLATITEIPIPSITRHLRRLQAADLVRVEGAGASARYRIGGRVTAIAGRETAYLRISGTDGAEAFITIPLHGQT